MTKSVSVIPILDNSASMSYYGFNFDATIFSKYFIELLRKGDKFAAVKFDYNAAIFYPSSNQLVTVDQNLSQPKKAVDALQATMKYDAEGHATNISDGLQKAKGLLDEDSSGNNRACVLLSDGWYNAGGDPLKNLPGYPVMTIGLGAASDIGKLNGIASHSGGTYFAVTRSREMGKVYTKIAQLDASANMIYNDYTNVDPTGAKDVPLIIPPSDGLVQIAAVWRDTNIQYTNGNIGNNQVRVTLYAPNSYDPYPATPKVIAPGYVIFEETGLQPGEWTMEYEYATSGTGSLDSLSACVHYPSSSNDRSLKVAVTAPQHVALGQPLTFSIGAMENGVPVTRLRATATVSSPTISVANALKKYAAELRSVQPRPEDLVRGMPEPHARLAALRTKLLEERNLDILAYRYTPVRFSTSGNGLTATIPNVTQAGAYSIDVKITGESPIEGPFQRAEMATIVVYDPDAP